MYFKIFKNFKNFGISTSNVLLELPRYLLQIVDFHPKKERKYFKILSKIRKLKEEGWALPWHDECKNETVFCLELSAYIEMCCPNGAIANVNSKKMAIHFASEQICAIIIEVNEFKCRSATYNLSTDYITIWCYYSDKFNNRKAIS